MDCIVFADKNGGVVASTEGSDVAARRVNLSIRLRDGREFGLHGFITAHPNVLGLTRGQKQHIVARVRRLIKEVWDG